MQISFRLLTMITCRIEGKHTQGLNLAHLAHLCGVLVLGRPMGNFRKHSITFNLPNFTTKLLEFIDMLGKNILHRY